MTCSGLMEAAPWGVALERELEQAYYPGLVERPDPLAWPYKQSKAEIADTVRKHLVPYCRHRHSPAVQNRKQASSRIRERLHLLPAVLLQKTDSRSIESPKFPHRDTRLLI